MSKKKPIKRPHVLPKDYLLALADKIHMQNPSRVIIFNTFLDIYCKAYTEGYSRRIDDSRYFKDKQEKSLQSAWNKEKDSLDDLIHNKNGKK